MEDTMKTLSVLTLDSGALLTGPDGALCAFDRPDAAHHARNMAATTLPCRTVSVRTVDANSGDPRERRAYNAILEYNLPEVDKEARLEGVTKLKASCPW